MGDLQRSAAQPAGRRRQHIEPEHQAGGGHFPPGAGSGSRKSGRVLSDDRRDPCDYNNRHGVLAIEQRRQPLGGNIHPFQYSFQRLLGTRFLGPRPSLGGERHGARASLGRLIWRIPACSTRPNWQLTISNSSSTDMQEKLLDDTIVAYEKALQLTINRFNGGVASQGRCSAGADAGRHHARRAHRSERHPRSIRACHCGAYRAASGRDLTITDRFDQGPPSACAGRTAVTIAGAPARISRRRSGRSRR